jgi:hypothetical protein
VKKYEYTYDLLAEAAGKTTGALRVDISRRMVNPDSLRSVAVYITLCRLKEIKT